VSSSSSSSSQRSLSEPPSVSEPYLEGEEMILDGNVPFQTSSSSSSSSSRSFSSEDCEKFHLKRITKATNVKPLENSDQDENDKTLLIPK
jgi:hypothetical protein